MNLTNLSAYDSFDLHHNAIADYLAYHEIDIDNVRNHPRFAFGGTKLTKGIEANRNAKGKVFLRLDDGYTDKDGNTHPNLTAVLNGGAIKLPTFSCWEHFKALTKNSYPVKSFTKNSTSEAERERRRAQSLQQEQQESEKSRRKFAQWNAAHLAAPFGSEHIETHPDVINHFGENHAHNITNHATSFYGKKGESSGYLVHPMTARRLTDNRGDCLSIGAVYEIDGEIKFYQRIYDRNIGSPDKPRNKDFCGSKKGCFHVIGNLAKGKYKGIYFVEGYMNGLLVHYATGCPVIVCFDAGNIVPVVKKFHDWGYQGLIIAPDNDIKADKANTGLIAAFKAVQDVSSAFIAPPYLDDGVNQIKCDYCDVFLVRGLQEVQRQLHKNSHLAFEYGEMYINRRISKDGRLKAEYESKFNAFMMQVLPHEQSQTKRQKIIANALAKYPSVQGYGTPEAITEKLLKIFIHERNKDALYNEIKIGCELKHEAVKRRNSLTKADLHGVIEFDRANPVDMAKLSKLIKENFATVICDLPMGSNKTGDMAVFIEEDLDGKSSIVVVPLSSLADSNAVIFESAHYRKNSMSDLATAQKVTICINSILSKFKNKKASDEFQHVFVDEVRRVLENILDGGTMQNPLEIYNEAIALILKSRLTWLSDADMNGLTLQFAKQAAPDKPIYRIIDSRERAYPLPPVIYRGGSVITLKHEIAERLAKGEKIYVFCDSPSMVKKLKHFLKSKGIKEHRILDIHAGTGSTKGNPAQQAFLANPNEEALKYDVVIASPVIQCGFSICNGHFDAVFGLVSTGILTSNEIAQSLYRVRDAKEIILAIEPQRQRNRPTSLQQLIDGEHNTLQKIRGNETVRLSDDGTKIIRETELDSFSMLQIQAIVQRNEDLNDLENSILIHLMNIGFNITHDIPAPPKKEARENMAKISKEVKAEEAAAIKQARSITSGEFVTLSAKKQSYTSEESYMDKRHQVEGMVGVTAHTDAQLEQLNNQHDDVITDDDVANYQNGLLARVHNRELLSVDIEDLKQLDDENHNKGKRHRHKTVARNLFDDVLESIKHHSVEKEFTNSKTGATKASRQGFDKAIAAKVCAEVLQANCADLSRNGYADYSKPIERPVSTLRNLLRQYGYNLVSLGRDTTQNENGERSRWYEVVPDAVITQYCSAREINRKNKPVQ